MVCRDRYLGFHASDPSRMSDVGAIFSSSSKPRLQEIEKQMRQLETDMISLKAEDMNAKTLAIQGMDLHYANHDLVVKLRTDIAHLRAENSAQMSETSRLLETHMEKMHEFQQKTLEKFELAFRRLRTMQEENDFSREQIFTARSLVNGALTRIQALESSIVILRHQAHTHHDGGGAQLTIPNSASQAGSKPLYSFPGPE
jgi:hypothetical protein